MNSDIEDDVIRVGQVHSAKHYDVWIVKFKDMPTATYGVINRETGVIEGVQPVLANAKGLAKQFSASLDDGNSDDSVLRLMPEPRGAK